MNRLRHRDLHFSYPLGGQSVMAVITPGSVAAWLPCNANRKANGAQEKETPPEAGQPFDATALFAAVESDDIGALRELLDVAVDLDPQDDKGRTPLMIAAIRGHRASYHMLLEAGASLQVTDHKGVPAITYVKAFGAMTHEHVRIMRAAMLKSIAMGFARRAREEKKSD